MDVSSRPLAQGSAIFPSCKRGSTGVCDCPTLFSGCYPRVHPIDPLPHHAASVRSLLAPLPLFTPVPRLFFASLGNTYGTYYVYKLTIHGKLLELHSAYRPIIPIRPQPPCTGVAFHKEGRSMGKSAFYDASRHAGRISFLWGEEDVYSRPLLPLGKTLLRTFPSKNSSQMAILIFQLHHYAKTSQTFDLKHSLNLYVLDFLGEVAFAKQFGVKIPRTTSNCIPSTTTLSRWCDW
ncbi:hypothetical protein BDW75DRAFT_243217 [Aspergillus navahoensis]